MQNKRDLPELKSMLQRTISEALNQAAFTAEIEIHEMVTAENYEVRGNFKFASSPGQIGNRKGKFEATLDENLKIVALKIMEDQQQ
jgi:hypothetical protein